MVEEFSKAGVRVGAHLNTVAPGKIKCIIKVDKCSSCQSLNLKRWKLSRSVANIQADHKWWASWHVLSYDSICRCSDK